MSAAALFPSLFESIYTNVAQGWRKKIYRIQLSDENKGRLKEHG
jgi:hypothetical protein